MFITSFTSGPVGTNTHLIVCPSTKVAAIVDPAPGSAEKVFDYITKHQLHPEKILLTHSHWDHIADVMPLQKRIPLPVYIHALDSPNLEHPGADQLRSPFFIKAVQPEGFLKDGDIVSVGTLQFKVIHTPGHTLGGICLYCPAHALLISGDTLFKGCMGRVSFPFSDPQLMWNSLKKLAQLPPDTVVYPGHGPTTTIGKEKWLEDAEKIFGN